MNHPPNWLRLASTAVVVLLSSFSAIADTADNIIGYSESQLLAAGKAMTEALSRSSPAQIDSTTVVLGAVFVQDTKTLIYKYESSVRLDPARMAEEITRHMCTDRIKRAFMTRGFTYKHLYLTPIGQQEHSVRLRDCN